MTDLDGTLTALADPTRRGVVDLLRERPHRAGELAAAMATSAPAMSRHLRVLRTTGLIEEERRAEDARLRIYHLRRKPFDDLQAWVEEVRSFWTDQLDAFKAYSESRTLREAEGTHQEPVNRREASDADTRHR